MEGKNGMKAWKEGRKEECKEKEAWKETWNRGRKEVSVINDRG
jgi:hypothetical protein